MHEVRRLSEARVSALEVKFEPSYAKEAQINMTWSFE